MCVFLIKIWLCQKIELPLLWQNEIINYDESINKCCEEILDGRE